uniref:Reverse transcriptase n=1 Tax=Haemonchus contortus TaxID=6289 RepID=A0A7I5EE19_HAECO
MGLERLHREDHTFFKVIVGDYNANIAPRRTAEELHIGAHGMEWNEQGERTSLLFQSCTEDGTIVSSAPDSAFHIEEEYNWLVEHIHDRARNAESLQVARSRLPSKTLELIRQRGIARATGNHQHTSELAKLCREAIKEDLKERRAAVMDEAAEAGKSIRKARRNLANQKTKMTFLRRPDGTATASRRAVEKVIHDHQLDLFDSRYMPTHHLRQNEYVATSFSLLKHLKRLPPAIVRALTRLFTRSLSECKAPTLVETSKTESLYKKGSR